MAVQKFHAKKQWQKFDLCFSFFRKSVKSLFQNNIVFLINNYWFFKLQVVRRLNKIDKLHINTYLGFVHMATLVFSLKSRFFKKQTTSSSILNCSQVSIPSYFVLTHLNYSLISDSICLLLFCNLFFTFWTAINNFFIFWFHHFLTMIIAEFAKKAVWVFDHWMRNDVT